MTISDFPSLVRMERKRRGWNQTELADRAGVSLRTVQNFENRKSNTQPENLRAMLLAVDIDPDGADLAADTREEWPIQIKVFLDMLGAYLMTLSPEDQLSVIHDTTRAIFERNG